MQIYVNIYIYIYIYIIIYILVVSRYLSHQFPQFCLTTCPPDETTSFRLAHPIHPERIRVSQRIDLPELRLNYASEGLFLGLR